MPSRAWAPERWHPRMERAYPLRRQDDPLEVVTLAFFEGDTEAIDAMHDDPHWMAGEERRLAGIAPLEQEIALTGGFEVGRGSSGGARRALTSIDRSHAYAKSAWPDGEPAGAVWRAGARGALIHSGPCPTASTR